MVDVECDAVERAGVTFVRATVRNDRRTAQLVRLESRLDGPTWPPRRAGARDPAWDGDAWEAVIDPGRRRGVGFASPAPPVDPPVELVVERRAPADRSPRKAVLSTLPEWAPPGDVALGDR